MRVISLFMLSIFLVACGESREEKISGSVNACKAIQLSSLAGKPTDDDVAAVQRDCECAVAKLSVMMADEVLDGWSEDYRGVVETIGDEPVDSPAAQSSLSAEAKQAMSLLDTPLGECIRDSFK